MASNRTSLESQLFKIDPAPNDYQLGLIISALVSKNINHKDKDGNTYLMRAVREGNIRVAQALINTRKIDEKAYNKEGFTALMLAVQSNNKEMIKLLCLQNNLYYRSYYDNDSVQAYYSMRSQKEKQTPLMFAVLAQNEEVVDLLLQGRLQENSKQGRATNKDGQTALMLAAQGANLEILKKIYTKDPTGANLNSIDKAGKTALMYAMENNHRENAIYLIAQGAALSHFKHSDFDIDLIQAAANLLLKEGKLKDRRMLLEKARVHYLHSPEIENRFKYQLIEQDSLHLDPDFGFQEDRAIPLCVQYALELNSGRLTDAQKAVKENILRKYWFGDQLDEATYQKSVLPTIALSHVTPKGTYVALKEIRAALFPEQVNTAAQKPELTTEQSALLRTVLHTKSEPGWFSRQWAKIFPKPSDVQILESLAKNPSSDMTPVLKRMLLKGEKIPEAIMKRYPSNLDYALKAILYNPPSVMPSPMIEVYTMSSFRDYYFKYDFYDLSGIRRRGELYYYQNAGPLKKEAIIEAFLLQQQIEEGWVMNDNLAATRAYEILGAHALDVLRNAPHYASTGAFHIPRSGVPLSSAPSQSPITEANIIPTPSAPEMPLPSAPDMPPPSAPPAPNALHLSSNDNPRDYGLASSMPSPSTVSPADFSDAAPNDGADDGPNDEPAKAAGAKQPSMASDSMSQTVPKSPK